MAGPVSSGALPNGWPLPRGVTLDSGSIVNPPADFSLGNDQPNWQVPSGKWWTPLYFGLFTQAAVGPPTWYGLQITVASDYFGLGQNPGLTESAIFHTGFAPVALQSVHISMGVFLGDSVQAPANAADVAYLSAGIIPMACGPGDNIRGKFYNGAGADAHGITMVAAEYDTGGSDGGQDLPFVATPILA